VEQWELSAYHEAGHAVAAHVLGLRVERVSIVEDEQSGGRTVVPWPKDFEPYDATDYALMEKRLAALYGGTKAVEILTDSRRTRTIPTWTFSMLVRITNSRTT